jgi:hypothetical protein
MYECDGCGAQFKEAESKEALEHFKVIPGEDLSKRKCWGLMEVGGRAWFEFYYEDTKPMAYLLTRIRAVQDRFN